MTQVELFYILSHISISFIGGVILLVIHNNIKIRFSKQLEDDENEKRLDKGLLYLGLAMFVWVASGLWNLASEELGIKAGFTYELGNHLLSIVNNLFILLALFYFYYAPSFIYKNLKNIKLIIYLILGVAMLTIILGYAIEPDDATKINFPALPDLLLSGFLSFLLGWSLYETFMSRGLRTVAIISALVVFMMFISQLPEVINSFENSMANDLVKLISKTSLIFIFLVLATSWVIRLANAPKVSEMQLKIVDWSLCQLTIPSKGILNQSVDFGSKTTQFKNLLKIAIRRKYGSGDTVSITVGKAGEIKSQSYLTRIIDNINEILNLEDDQLLERRDLFTFLGEGRYRIRLLEEHINIEPNLLEEFIKSNENSLYKDLYKS